MVEQRFQKFKNTIKPKEFNSIAFLIKAAEELKTKDPELSSRILVRVRNLERQRQKVATRQQQSNTDVFNKKQVDQTEGKQKNKNKKWKMFFYSPYFLCVVIPLLLFSFYQIVLATPRFESRAQVIVQKPDSASTLDSSLALLSGLGGSAGDSDTEILKAYIYSNDMVAYLNKNLHLREHYSEESIDYFSRIHDKDGQQAFLDFYRKHVTVTIEGKSGIVLVECQAFDSEFAQKLTNEIVKRAEWYINSISHQLAKAQLAFIQGEYLNVESRLQNTQTELLNFQQRYNLLDPTAEGTAMQQIAYALEGKITAKQTELKTTQAIMSSKAPQVLALNNELDALYEQLKKERAKLSQDGEKEVPVSEILSKFTDLKVKMELALKSYTASQISLEKSRIEAYRQAKYLVVVEAAILSDKSKYPDVIYNISLFLLLASIFFGIGKIIISTIYELK